MSLSWDSVIWHSVVRAVWFRADLVRGVVRVAHGIELVGGRERQRALVVAFRHLLSLVLRRVVSVV